MTSLTSVENKKWSYDVLSASWRYVPRIFGMNCSFAINNLAQLYGFFPSEVHRVTAVKRFADVKKLKCQTAANGVKVTPQYRFAANAASDVEVTALLIHIKDLTIVFRALYLFLSYTLLSINSQIPCFNKQSVPFAKPQLDS